MSRICGGLDRSAPLNTTFTLNSAGERGPQALDLLRIAKTVQHEVRARAGKRRAMPSPMPLVEPVTMAVLPFNISIPPVGVW